MNERQLLVLAFGIAEWASALDHLNALRVVGERIPYSVIGRMQAELSELCERWSRNNGHPFVLSADERTQVVADARDYCTQHGDELEKLRAESE